jgi:CRISPR-associated endonuclease/helicase Cas3
MIYAAPYLSITTQNAREMRRAFGSERVLEHHSGIDLGLLPAAGLGQDRQAMPVRNAAENWDMPVVVTTVVQLFESLFSDRPQALRKVHRLTGSVIVLDEVQSLPDRLLLPILSALRDLTAYFGSTVVLCSATQPAFEALPPLRDLQDKGLIRDIAPAAPSHAAAFRRVRYEWQTDPGPPLRRVAQEAAGHDQVLVIVNTTGDAARVHEAMEEAGADRALHLSTRMTAAHRAGVLADIRARLREGQAVQVVATQLIEAGVDVDFPVVYRAWAPAEALCQAAGRANREGHRSSGRVIIFDPPDGRAPGDYATAMDVARQYFGPGRADPDNPKALHRYYQTRYLAKGTDGEAGGAGIQERREALDFLAVAERFRMIDDIGVPVVAPYASAGHPAERLRALIAQARAPRGMTAKVLRDLQPWTATLPRSAAAAALRCGDAEVLAGDLILWGRDYHPQRGIVTGAAPAATIL